MRMMKDLFMMDPRTGLDHSRQEMSKEETEEII